MKKIRVEDFADFVYRHSDDTSFDLIEKINLPELVKLLIYNFIKAYQMHVVKITLYNRGQEYEKISRIYKERILTYFRNNGFDSKLLEEISNFYDTSINLIETLNFKDFDDTYELRHHLIDSLEILRNVLEKKIEGNIREDLFDNYIRKLSEESEDIIIFAKTHKI